MNIVYAVYGAGGFGRQVLSFFKLQFASNKQKDILFCYIDDNSNLDFIDGDKVLSYSEFLDLDCPKKYINITIANSVIRENISNNLHLDKTKLFSIISNQSTILSPIKADIALILSPYTVISTNVSIGKYCHIGFHSSISHDCTIGDYVTIATGVRCNGNVYIEDHAYIGSGAVIKQGTPEKPLVIGKGAVVGMGAVVTKSVPPGVTVIGNPARILEKK